MATCGKGMNSVPRSWSSKKGLDYVKMCNILFILISSYEPERPKTPCEHHRDSIQTTSPEGYPIIGAYVPQCDANGQYSPLQVCEKLSFGKDFLSPTT